MKKISRINTSFEDRSKTAVRRVKKIIPILEDCFRNMVYVDEHSTNKEQVLEMLNDLIDNEQYHRLPFEDNDGQ